MGVQRRIKSNIVSIRMSDEEFNAMQRIMNARKKHASAILHEALALFKEQWERTRRLETATDN
jgi:predicted transcriptional regulator